MNIERTILITFAGNYLITKVLAALVVLIPSSSTDTSFFTAPYIVFIVLTAILVGGLTWWNMQDSPRGLQSGVIFGVAGFVMAIVVSFVSGVSGILSQSGTLSAVVNVLPTFGEFIASWSTVILFAYWVVPAALVGWYLARDSKAKAPTV